VILLFVVSTFLAGLYSLRLDDAVTKLLPKGPDDSAYTQTVLLEDHFLRLNQTYWGAAAPGLSWGGNANNNPAFAVRNERGIVSGKGFFVATIPVATNDMEIRANVSFDDFGHNWFGAILRVSNQSYWYEARVESDKISLYIREGMNQRGLVTMPVDLKASQKFTLRFRSIGDQIMAKVWPAGTSEPVEWQVIFTDSKLTIGYSGLIVNLVDPAATLTVYDTMLYQLDKKAVGQVCPEGGSVS
jgi:hypothetical protein